jgi:hypothetical protein
MTGTIRGITLRAMHATTLGAANPMLTNVTVPGAR